MMRQMREATKPIMFLAAVAFVALMVFEWGMDITGRSSGSYGEIGRVNGDPVMYEDYMSTFRNLLEQVQRSQEEPVTSLQNQQIEDQAFDEVVNQILIRQELERRGITVSDREIAEAAQFNPPSDLLPQFTREDGSLDRQSYQSFLAQLPQDKLLILEAYYRDVIPRGKLLKQVSSGLYIPDAYLWQDWKDRNEVVEVRYVPFDPSVRYDDADFPVSDAEVQRYYDDHQDEFEFPANATVKVVVLSKTPTPEDTVASYDRAVAIRQEILGGADFAEVAARESSDQGSAQAGGELGTFPKGRMVAPFDSAVFATRVGTVTTPVKSAFGYHVIEVSERWGADSASARHILVPIERTDDSEIALLTLADSLEDLGQSYPLEEAAGRLGLEAATVDVSGNFAFVTGAGQISEGADWAFEEASPGDVSPVFENAQAFYALELVSSRVAGVLPLEEARPAVEATLIFDKKMARALEEGSEVVAKVRQGEALPNVAADMRLEIRSPAPFTRSDFVPGLGRQNAAIGAAFGLTPGQVSDVVSTPANAFVIELLSREPADSLAWMEQKEQQRSIAMNVLQQQRLQDWIMALRAAAKIVDRRDQVLVESNEDAPVQLPPIF
ncbi:MAG: peptidylprolyl isomerase [Gemmatimonadota bacterium]|nr:peptidylprolyl isomerase [Gemmatimonadota bacterium]